MPDYWTDMKSTTCVWRPGFGQMVGILAHALWISRYRLDARRSRRAGGQRQRRILGEASTAIARSIASREAEAAFIAERDSLYMATVSESGWPYVQHRGGPPGFIRVLDDRTLAIPDFRGNRQYISTGNLATNDRAALILMDYPHRRRLKIYAHVEAKDLGADPELAGEAHAARLQGQGRARPRHPSRRIRLELPAAHHSAIQRSRTRARARAVSRAARSAGSGKQGVARRTGGEPSAAREAREWRRRTPEAKEPRSRSGSPTPRTDAATLVSRLLAKAPMMSLRRVNRMSAMTGAGRAMLSTTWLMISALVELTPSQTTTNAGIMVTSRRTKTGMRNPTKPCMIIWPAMRADRRARQSGSQQRGQERARRGRAEQGRQRLVSGLDLADVAMARRGTRSPP